ncbi:Crp/Fnr family transcriptional regulator [Argonema galeatum]|uniref:Crp/Fnr family transcriptional regulator n=1 Tax=Argonema galeatum TaxID=2942762 RepID=UPI00201250F1|nr:Crp/Fnr family transcriptional regulator [Argonema galeatum]MCL1468588.1 Crp/Fnr family transcriptional regulator [Argonema galeatum A003/A1]
MTPFTPTTNGAYVITRRKFARGSLLVLNQDYLWQIESGVVRTMTWREDGTCITFGLWGPGDLVGRAISKADPYQIECLSDLEATLLPASRWYQATDAMLLHMQRLGEFLEIVHSKPIETSLLLLISWLGKRFGREVEQGQIIDLRLTHQQMAEIVGSSRVTVTRILNNFEKQGIIERVHRKLVVVQEPSLWHYEI